LPTREDERIIDMQAGLTEKGKIIKGFKATTQDMKCNNFEFRLNEWYEHDGEISLCEKGFHFCPHMSGVWSYYPSDSRVFEVEAECVLIDYQPGADLKYVAKRIRLLKEVKIGGDRNTGHRNTGHRNTGHRNTGDRNTGYSNATDRCAGFFCQNKQKVRCFDVATNMTYEQFRDKYSDLYYALANDLIQDAPFDYERYKSLPGWTLRRIKSLHKKHIKGRMKV